MFDCEDVLSLLKPTNLIANGLCSNKTLCHGHDLNDVNSRLSESIDSLRELSRYNNRRKEFAHEQKGSKYKQEKRYSNALRFYREALVITKGLVGEERHPDIADIHVSMATVFKKKSMYDESMRAFEKALSMYEDAIEDEVCEYDRKRCLIIKSADTLNSIGDIYLQKGELDIALEKYHAALLVTEKSIPESEESDEVKSHWSETLNIHWAETLNNLATVHAEKGNVQESLKIHNLALEMQMKYLGEDNIAVANTLNKIATINFKDRNFVVALKVFRQALKMRRKLLGWNHNSVADVLNNLGLVQLMMNQLDVAATTFSKALDVSCTALGKQDLKTADIYANMGFLAEKQNDVIKAIYNFNKARKIYKINGLADDHECVKFVTRGSSDFAASSVVSFLF
eukprot:CAMPEP_0172521362 /NCGR_PEP_ID=MMETSP1066-20121228/292539_1 /TAXON_ID=671091 /ORGANISM="Coscinodiscus wailesii, Strain CCMP2513" /LENGTH=398 /DNA_ID=CAMNT_0013304269 /DNA_START=644 /DNA_END=1840 /DNA_ORIENTATION=-